MGMEPKRSTVLLTIFTLAAMLVLASCSVEALAEKAVESAVSAETGEDVDLDFDGGSFSVETEEGSLSFDAESGEFVVTDENGDTVADGSVGLEDGNLSVESTEGNLEFESESGEFTATGADGTVTTGTIGEDGFNMNVDGEEEVSMRSGDEVTNDWPLDVLALYPGATVQDAVEMNSADGSIMIVTLETSDSRDQVHDFYTDATADWEGTRSTMPDGSLLALSDGEWTTQIVVGENNGATTVNLTLTTETS